MQKAITVLYVDVVMYILPRTVCGPVIIIRQVGDRYFPLLCSKIMKYLDYNKIIRSTALICCNIMNDLDYYKIILNTAQLDRWTSSSNTVYFPLSLALVQTNLLLLAINERVSVFVERLEKSDE